MHTSQFAERPPVELEYMQPLETNGESSIRNKTVNIVHLPRNYTYPKSQNDHPLNWDICECPKLMRTLPI